MNGKKKLVILILAIFVAAAAAVGTFCSLSCKNKGKDNSESAENGIAKNAEYYCVAEDEEYVVTLTNGKTYYLSVAGDRKTGDYTLSESGELKLIVDGKEVQANINGDELTVTYGGKGYTLLEKIKRSVTFDEGGTTEVKTVINGKPIEKPADPAEKDGKKFVGWYTSADYSEIYNFAAPVRSDITVYAQYIDSDAGAREFTATLKDGSDKKIQTINGVVYGLESLADKDGKEFDGWYVSDFDDEAKLTYKYTDEVLKENVNLYPVWKDGIYGVKVAGDDITWSADGAVAFKVTVSATGFDKTLDTTQTKAEYKFSEAAAGEYKIVITDNAGNIKFEAYYNNKALARVSDFVVTESGMLIYNPVENAEKYIITVDCGNKNHKHTATDNGTYTYFDISGCEMQKGGIKVTIKAEASGFVSSEGVFVYDKTLDSVSEIEVKDGKLVWNAIGNALGYVVMINGEEVKTDVNEYSLKEYAEGKYDIEVYPVSYKYNSPEAATFTYNKQLPATPAGIVINGNVLKWKAVENATGYSVRLNGKEYTVSANEKVLDSDDIKSFNKVTVTAFNETSKSEESDEFEFANDLLQGLKYDCGKVYWTPVAAADSYAVSVNGGKETNYNKETVSAPVSFTESGENVITVSYYCDDGTVGDSRTTTVTVYEIKYMGKNGQSEVEYKAKGDTLGFPAEKLTVTGFDIDGWYDVPDGGANNGARYLADKLLKSGGITLYADFLSKAYNVTLQNGDEQSVEQVRYNENYTLSIPESDDENLVFGGWFFQPNGVGEQYTDMNGASLKKWKTAHDEVILYANWLKVFEYTLNGAGTGYNVTEGKGLPYVTEATVKNIMGALPVVSIDSLAGADKLEYIKIPDTVKFSVGMSEGVATSAFAACRNLKSIMIYETSGVDKSGLTSDDGAIYVTDAEGDKTTKTLVLIPYGKTGAFTVAHDATALASGALSGSALTKVTVSSSVTEVGNNAFKNSKQLTEVEFLAEKEGEKVKELTFGKNVFFGCDALVKLTLPGRLKASSCEFASSVDASVGLTMDFDKEIFGTNAYKAVDGIASLERIDVVGEKVNYSSVDGILTDKDEKKVIYCPRGRTADVTLPNTVTEIGNGAFGNCKLIENVSIPATVTTIRDEAFMGCSDLASLTFGGDENDNALSIGQAAFYRAGKLEKVTLPANLTHIGKYAFYSAALKEVTVGSVGVEDGTLDFADSAFGSIPLAGSTSGFAVTKLTLGKDTPLIGISAVFGYKIETVVLDKANKNYFIDSDGALYSADKTRLLCYPKGGASDIVIADGVEEIDANLFRENANLRTVKIPASLKKIGDNAFAHCGLLVKIEFASDSASVTIGNFAFNGCKSLSSVSLPSGLTKIGDKAFYNNTSLSSVTFGGNKLTEIGESAFGYCNALTEITLPEGLEVIGGGAFEQCNSLVTVNFPASLVEMGENIFTFVDDDGYTKSCESLAEVNFSEGNPKYASVDGVMYEKVDGIIKNLIYCPVMCDGKDGVVEIPGTVENVAANAFYGNKVITEVKFLNGSADRTIELGKNLFNGADKLTKVTLPGGLKTVGDFLLQNTSVKEIIIPNTVRTISNNAFLGAKKLEKVIFESGNEDLSLTIADGSGGSGAFTQCISLKEIEFPERTVKIGIAAFDIGYGATSSLKKVKLPASVTEIGKYAFQGCNALETVEFAQGSKLKTIADSAFVNSRNLKNINFPEGLVTIGNQAFQNTGLTEVTLPSSVTMIGNAFNSCNSLRKITIGDGVTSITKGAFVDCKSLSEVIMSNSVTSIGEMAFKNCVSLAEITLGDSVTVIGEQAFYNTSLKKIKMGAGVTSVGKEAFKFSELAEVEFAVGGTGTAALQSIGDEAFVGTGITVFEIPETADKITLGSSLFKGCINLTELKISSKVASLGNSLDGLVTLDNVTVAEDNENLSVNNGMLCSKDGHVVYCVFGVKEGELKLPDNVQEIKADAYKGQPDITKVIIPGTIKTIGANAFANCGNLVEVVFIDNAPSIESIGNGAFENCTSLTNINLPGKLESLGNSVFNGCSALAFVSFGEELKTIGSSAFKGTALKAIEIPASVTSVGSEAFAGTQITSVAIPANVKTIGASAFAGCFELSSVTFADNSQLTSLGSYAFNGTKISDITLPSMLTAISANMLAGTQITSFVVPESVTDIGDYAFDGMASLETITINVKGLKEIGEYAFRDCTSLRSIEIPEGVTKINRGAFLGCTNLSSVKLPSTVTMLGTTRSSKTSVDYGYVFKECTSLKTIDLPDKISYIGPETFSGSGLVSIKLPKSLKYLTNKNCLLSKARVNLISKASAQFKDCVDLETVILPAGLQAIGMNVFYNTPKLKTMTYDGAAAEDGNCLPASTVEMCASSFNGCGLESLKILGTLKSGTYNRGILFRDSSLKKIDLSASKITSLRYNLFKYANNLEEVVLPESLTTIEYGAFVGCENLKRVNFPAGLTAIAYDAFKGCSSLEEIDISGVTSIASGAFEGCGSLKSVKLGDSLTAIPDNAFKGCSSLESIDIPDSVTTLGSGCFASSGLTAIRLSAKVNSIGGGALSAPSLIRITVDKDNANYIVKNGFLIEGGVNAVAFPNGKPFVADETLTLPEGVTNIASDVFAKNVNVKKLSVPSTLVKIPDGAFRSFEGLEEVTLADGIQEIGNDAFSGCVSLCKINLPSSLIKIGETAFNGCVSLATMDFATANPEVVLGDGSFSGAGLTSLDMSALNMKSIADRAFFGCQSLIEVKLPKNLEKLGNSAFNGCIALETVEFGDKLTYIDVAAFNGCSALKSVALPESLTDLMQSAFQNSGLTSVTLPMGVTDVKNAVFSGCEQLVEFKASGELTKLSDSAFKGCSALKSITIGSSVENIGNNVFGECSALETVTFETGANPIFGKEVFENCTSLKTITLPAGITEISEKMFGGAGLTEIVLPDSVTTVGSRAFENCVSLTDVTLPAKLSVIPNYMFYGSGITEITLPASVHTIGSNAFADCKALQTITLSEMITEISEAAFTGSGLTQITLPDSVRTIGDYAFMNCKSLASVTLGNGLCEIGMSAFEGCTGVKSVIIPSRVYSLDKAFVGWGEDQTIAFALKKSQAAKLFGHEWLSGCNATIAYNG